MPQGPAISGLTSSILHRTRLIISYLVFKEYYATFKIVPLGGEENGKIKIGLRNWVDHWQNPGSPSHLRKESGRRDPKLEVTDTRETVLAIPYNPTTLEMIGRRQ